MSREKKALDRAIKRLEKAEEAVCEAALEYARVETIAYSKTLPKRKVQFCCAMGSTALHVERRGLWKFAGDYLITTGSHGDDVPVPEYLRVLDDAEYASGLNTLAGPLNLTCRNGEILRDLED